MSTSELILFKGKNVRRHWDEKQEKWPSSVVDIISILIDQPNHKKAQSYWTTLKFRLKNEGSQVVTKCDQLKMTATDGKEYATDVADTETLFRLIQSVPSPKAEPIKLWLAKVGNERLQEIADPEKSLNRARSYWQKMGRSKKWIQQRMMGQEIRNKLTDYWQSHKVTKQEEYAVLTNIIHQEWSGLTVKEHKSLKRLKQHNLKDHMTDAELIFTALAELSTRQIAEVEKATGFEMNKTPAIKGGKIAKNARLELEEKTGKNVITNKKFLTKTNTKRIK